GGILETSNVGNNAVTIGGTSNLTSGNGQDLVVLQNNTAGTMTISAPVSGSIAVTKAGAGTLVLSGTNTFTGGLKLNAGTVSYSADANLGAASGAITFNGGTLTYTAASATVPTRW